MEYKINNIRNIKETKLQMLDKDNKSSNQLKYDKYIVYGIFNKYKNIDNIIVEIKNILLIYSSNVKDIYNDFLEVVIEKNLLHEKLVINFIYNEIKRNNFVFYDVVEYYKSKGDYFNLIKIVCCLIDLDDTCFFVVKKLSFLLNEINNADKKKIIELLMFFYKNSNKPRGKNIFLNEIEILQQKTILKSKPRIIDVTVTLKCNLKCIMCNVNNEDNSYELDEYIYNFLITNIKYLENITWKGGEVFLYKNFLNLLKMASDNNVGQTIITNGLLLNEEIIEMFCKNNIFLAISIDAAEKELYEKIRVGGKFEKLLENINILKKMKKKYPKFSYSMHTVLTNINYRTIDDIISFAYNSGFDMLYFMKCAPSKYNKHLLLNDNDIEYIKNKLNKNRQTKIKIEYDIAFQILKDNKVFNYRGNNCNDELKEDFKESVFCLLPWKKLTIDDMSISFDCHCKTIKIDSNDTDIWNSKKMVEYRKNIIQNREKACRIFLRNNKNEQ